MRRSLLIALALIVAADAFGYDGARRVVGLRQSSRSRTVGTDNYRNRSFDPATGRFLQRDPVLGGDPLFNPYCFPGNNPVTNMDPMGLWVVDLETNVAVAEEGDTLEGLAEAITGKSSRWKELNYKGNPKKMRVGAKVSVARWAGGGGLLKTLRGQVGWIYTVKNSELSFKYVGSADDAQERLTQPKHKARAVLTDEETRVDLRRNFAQPDQSATERDTERAARNQAKRAGEQKIITLEESMRYQLKGGTNDALAAEPQNEAKWTEAHRVRTGPPITVRGAQLANGAFAAAPLVQVVTGHLAGQREANMNAWKTDVLGFKSPEGSYQVWRDFHEWCGPIITHSNWRKVYSDGRVVPITESEYDDHQRKAKEVWGHFDWQGKFIFGTRDGSVFDPYAQYRDAEGNLIL